MKTPRHVAKAATRPARLEGVWYSENGTIAPEFVKFAEDRLLPLVTLDGYKIDRKREVAIRCLHSLALAELRDPPQVIMDGRDNSRNGLRIAVWDALRDAKLCRIYAKGIAGFPGGTEGYVTQYRASRKLLSLLLLHKTGRYVHPVLARNTQLEPPTQDAYIVLHSGRRNIESGQLLPSDEQKQPLPFPAELCSYMKRQEDRIVFCNNIMSQHTWKIPAPLAYEPCFILKQTHSGELNRYTRLVGLTRISIQELSESERKTILIDDTPATELDFGQFDIRLRYHWARIDPRGDAYKPKRIFPAFYASQYASKFGKEIIRKFVKTVTNICLNCDSKTLAGRATGQVLREWPERPQQFLWGFENERSFLYRVLTDIEQLTESRPDQIIERILHTHRQIKHLFFTKSAFWMSHGTAIIGDVWYQFAKADKPCYTIHDSVVCRASDRQFAIDTMKAMYHRWNPSGFEPQINVKY